MIQLTEDVWCDAHIINRIEIKLVRDTKMFCAVYTLKDDSTILSKNYEDLDDLRYDVFCIVVKINEELRHENY